MYPYLKLLSIFDGIIICSAIDQGGADIGNNDLWFIVSRTVF